MSSLFICHWNAVGSPSIASPSPALLPARDLQSTHGNILWPGRWNGCSWVRNREQRCPGVEMQSQWLAGRFETLTYPFLTMFLSFAGSSTRRRHNVVPVGYPQALAVAVSGWWCGAVRVTGTMTQLRARIVTVTWRRVPTFQSFQSSASLPHWLTVCCV